MTPAPAPGTARGMHPPYETAPALAAATGLRHGFFGRQGGVSPGIYSSLNAGEGSDDTPGNVAENRARIAAALGASHLLSCYQVHSPRVVSVTDPWTERPEADAMVTDRAGLGLCILSADCTPVLFADAEAGIIGAAHAGWKGALAGVLLRTVEAMEALGADRARIRAAIGPTIQQPSYEVGPEFRCSFIGQDPANAALFRGGKGDRVHFDLPGFCLGQLSAAGLAHVDNLGHDTCAMETTYFSNRRRNRRGEPDYGRNASVILLTG